MGGTSNLIKRTFKSGRGESQIWVASSGVICWCVTGYLEEDFTLRFIERGDEIKAGSAGALEIFCDWEGVTGYDTSCRERLAEWVTSDPESFRLIHVLVKSRLVAMGVAVGGLLVPQVRAYSTRAKFEVLLAQATEKGASSAE